MDLRERCARNICLARGHDPDRMVRELVRPPFMGATISPCWRTHLLDVDSVMETISDACAEEGAKRAVVGEGGGT